MPSLIDTLDTLEIYNDNTAQKLDEQAVQQKEEEKSRAYDYPPAKTSMIANFTSDDFNFLYKFSQSLNKKTFSRIEAEQILANAIDNKLIDPADTDLILDIDKSSQDYTALKIINLITCINYFRWDFTF